MLLAAAMVVFHVAYNADDQQGGGEPAEIEGEDLRDDGCGDVCADDEAEGGGEGDAMLFDKGEH